MKMIYLACPYTHNQQEVRFMRQKLADRYAARLTDHAAVFSPITHGPRLEPHLPERLKTSHAFWMRQCLPILRKSDAMYLLPLDGWRESKGVQEELRFCATALIPVIVVQNLSVDSVLEKLTRTDMLAIGADDVHWLNIGEAM
jgi:hypothetical protein